MHKYALRFSMPLASGRQSTIPIAEAISPQRRLLGGRKMVNTGTTATRISDHDRDALHVLPLSALDLETRVLKDARLIKNNAVRSVVELFSGEGIGSGQLNIEDLSNEFGWEIMDPPKDLVMLRKLALLPSFDVYSLRISLRELGIRVNDLAALNLSDRKKAELSRYMKAFTEPLITRIYGDEDLKINGFDDVIGLFADPNVAKARARLQAMAESLGIGIMEVPKFLEDFGDVFLSLSYFRSCMDHIEPIVDDFSVAIDDLKKSYQFKNNYLLMQTCDLVESSIVNLLTAIGGRLETFERDTENMWADLSAEKFQRVKSRIQSNHRVIGGSLCALSVKMEGWARQFPERDVGGPVRRSEFIMSEMKEGLTRLREIQAAA
jgi:hypothetical protein